MTAPEFDIEHARAIATASLEPAHVGEFTRLVRAIVHGPAFQLLLVDCRDERLRRKLVATLEQVVAQAGLGPSATVFADTVSDVAGFEDALITATSVNRVVHVFGLSVWLDDARVRTLNLRREAIARDARACLVWWVNAEVIVRLATDATDLWTWRSGVYEFGGEVIPLDIARVVSEPRKQSSAMSLDQRVKRVTELKSILAEVPGPDDAVRGALLYDLAVLLEDLGLFDESIESLRQASVSYTIAVDERMRGRTFQAQAIALANHGDFTNAISILRSEVLPLLERFGSEPDVASARISLAGMLAHTGACDEALVLIDSAIEVVGRTANRAYAVALGTRAVILAHLNRADEAIHSLLDEQIPLLKTLALEAEYASSATVLASVLAIRGELDQAIEVLTGTALPAFERIANARGSAITGYQLGLSLIRRNRPGDHALAGRHFRTALALAKRINHPIADEIDHALLVLQESAPAPPRVLPARPRSRRDGTKRDRK